MTSAHPWPRQYWSKRCEIMIHDSKMRGGPSAIGEGPCSELSDGAIKRGERHDSLLVFVPTTSSLTLSMADSQMVRTVAFAVNLRSTKVTANVRCLLAPSFQAQSEIGGMTANDNHVIELIYGRKRSLS